MDDLAQWYSQQLDEDERITRAAPQGPWSTDDAGSIVDIDGGRVAPSVGGAVDGRSVRWPEGPVVDHILKHDPMQTSRELAVKRQLLRELEKAEFTLSVAEPGTPPHDVMTGAVNTLRRVVRLHAQSCGDRPGYKPEWRP